MPKKYEMRLRLQELRYHESFNWISKRKGAYFKEVKLDSTSFITTLRVVDSYRFEDKLNW